MFRLRSTTSNAAGPDSEPAPAWISIDAAMPPAVSKIRDEDPYFGPMRSFGGRCYLDQWRSPAAPGSSELDSPHPWTALARLQDAMTPVGLEWLALRRESTPAYRNDGSLPPARRLWEWDGFDGGAIGLLHSSDARIAIACDDHGRLLEVWASPSAEAYAAMHGISTAEAYEIVNIRWDEILYQARFNSSACMVVGFTVHGERDRALDLG